MKRKNHKLVRVNNFWSNNYFEYESNSDRNKALSDDKRLKKIILFLPLIIMKGV